MTVFDLQWLLTTVADPSFEQERSVEQSQCVTVPFWNDLGLCLTYCMIVDASVVWPFQFGKESATKLNPDTACSCLVASKGQWPFCQLRNTARLSQRKGWNMLRSSTRHHVINLVAIERDLSEKSEVFD